MPDYMFLLEKPASRRNNARRCCACRSWPPVLGFNVLPDRRHPFRDLITGAKPARSRLHGRGQSLQDGGGELEKGGAKSFSPRERKNSAKSNSYLRAIVEGSISAARDEHYVPPRHAPGNPLVHDHGGPAPARFFIERHRYSR